MIFQMSFGDKQQKYIICNCKLRIIKNIFFKETQLLLILIIINKQIQKLDILIDFNYLLVISY